MELWKLWSRNLDKKAFTEESHNLTRNKRNKKRDLGLMKRKALELTIIAAALFTIQLVFIAAANPVVYFEIPTEPDPNPPLVTINSPMENQTIDSQNIMLSFTVTKPETWIRLTIYSNTTYLVLGNITSFYYVIDGVESQHIPVQDISSVYSDNPRQTLEFTSNLTLTEGPHTLYLNVEAETKYRDNSGSVMDQLLSNVVDGTSEVVNFTITKPEPQLESEPFPTTVVATVSGVSIAFIVTSLLVYFKKHKH